MGLRDVVGVTYGTDPELFVSMGGEVVGCERVVPKEGLMSRGMVGFVRADSDIVREDPKTGEKYVTHKGELMNSPLVVRDGVQIELHPPHSTSVNALCRNIGTCLEVLDRQLAKSPEVKLDWRGVVDVSWDELNKLTPEARLLGCAPSLNVYGGEKETKPFPEWFKPEEYNVRSTGGHIHFGLTKHDFLYENRRQIIPLMDILTTNQCVMLDRDPRAAERRVVYGRAGEYRKPLYGIEYRTLSNFWLKNPTLFDFVFGMSRFVLAVCVNPEALNELEEVVKIDKFIEAIDKNDYDLAMNNYEQVVWPFIAKYSGPSSGFPLHSGNLKQFGDFCERARVEGLDGFFNSDPVEAWTKESKQDFNYFLKSTY